MEIIFALVSGKTLHFAPHHKIRIYLEQKDVLVEGSEGEDVFTYNGTLLPDTTVVATGRKAVHTPQPDLAAFEGTPGVAVPLETDALEDMTLWVDNNFILSQGELQTYYHLQATVDGRKVPLSLHTPMVRVEWKEKGLFGIALSGIAKNLKKV